MRLRQQVDTCHSNMVLKNAGRVNPPVPGGVWSNPMIMLLWELSGPAR
jgi:hypothetical protein